MFVFDVTSKEQLITFYKKNGCDIFDVSKKNLGSRVEELSNKNDKSYFPKEYPCKILIDINHDNMISCLNVNICFIYNNDKYDGLDVFDIKEHV